MFCRSKSPNRELVIENPLFADTMSIVQHMHCCVCNLGFPSTEPWNSILTQPEASRVPHKKSCSHTDPWSWRLKTYLTFCAAFGCFSQPNKQNIFVSIFNFSPDARVPLSANPDRITESVLGKEPLWTTWKQTPSLWSLLFVQKAIKVHVKVTNTLATLTTPGLRRIGWTPQTFAGCWCLVTKFGQNCCN